MKIMTRFFLLVVVVMLSGCLYGSRSVMQTATYYKTVNGKEVVDRVVETPIPVVEREVVYPVATGTVEVFPFYSGYGYYGGYYSGYYPRKEKETQKDKSESSYWNYNGPNGFSAGGQKDYNKQTNKWHRK